MTAEILELYRRFTPPMRIIPVALDPFPIGKSVSEEGGVARVVRNLHLNRSGGPSEMRVEYLWAWLRGSTREELTDPSRFQMHVGLIQAAFCEGSPFGILHLTDRRPDPKGERQLMQHWVG